HLMKGRELYALCLALLSVLCRARPSWFGKGPERERTALVSHVARPLHLRTRGESRTSAIWVLLHQTATTENCSTHRRRPCNCASVRIGCKAQSDRRKRESRNSSALPGPPAS